MLVITGPKVGEIADKIIGEEIDGVHFTVDSVVGIQLKLKSDSELKSDRDLVPAVKSYIKNMPETQGYVHNVGYLNDQGMLLQY